MAPGAVAAPSFALAMIRNGKHPFPAKIAPPRSKRPNVLLIVLDTVRADHMSCYGYRRQTSPYIDAFAQTAKLYKNVLSPANWTAPGHASLFTGLPASAHGTNWPDPFLPEQFEVLAGQLKSSGYQTAGLATNGLFVTPHFGFSRGFEMFWNPPRKAENVSSLLLREMGVNTDHFDSCSDTTAMHHRLGRWFDEEYQPHKPFFIFLNYMDPHYPYIPPLSSPLFSKPASWHKWDDLPHERLMEYTLTGANTLTPNDINDLVALYDEEIAYADRKVHELLEFFRVNGLDENTIIIITSDHGELWGEHHMLCHESTVYEPLVRVPLIVRFPDRLGTGIETRLVQSHDVYPTILEICGVEWRRRAAHNCRSLLQQDRSEPRSAISELLAPRMGVILQRTFPNIERYRIVEPVRALQVGDMKLILDVKGTAELYDLASDPLERNNLATEKQEVVRTLRTQLEGWLSSFEHYQPRARSSQNRRKMTPKEREALKALGYVE